MPKLESHYSKGIPAKDIILDYDNVKDKIEKINGQANPDF